MSRLLQLAALIEPRRNVIPRSPKDWFLIGAGVVLFIGGDILMRRLLPKLNPIWRLAILTGVTMFAVLICGYGS